MFITLEGIEGAGKSTAALFVVEYLKSLSIPVIHTREPGGTIIAERIRQILLAEDPTEKLNSTTELLLMFAARSQHLTNLILPALNKGNYVVCERFTDASFAYQGGGRGINFSWIQLLQDLVQQDFKPDLTFLLDLQVATGLARIKQRNNLDRIEQERIEFFHKIREVYLQLAKMEPHRYYIINAEQDLSIIQQEIITVLEDRLNART